MTLKRLLAGTAALTLASQGSALAGHNEPVGEAQIPKTLTQPYTFTGAHSITGALKLPSFSTAIDLTYAGSPQSDFVALAQGGMISYCPMLSCVYTPSDGSTPTPSFYDHQRGSLVVSHITNDDAHSEEQTLGIETKVVTGYTKPYAANTAYTFGDNIQVGNATYRAVSGSMGNSAGTTGANSAPPGTRPTAAQGGAYRVTDGTVTWQWINDAAIGAKAGIYAELSAQGPLAGPWWGMAINSEFGAGMTPKFGAGIEIDQSNNSGKDCALGTCQAYGIFMRLAGNNTQTAGLYMAASSATNYNAYYGALFAGAKLASVADVEANGSGSLGMGICADGIANCSHAVADLQFGYNKTMPSMGPAAINIVGPHSSASISDSSTTPASLAISGSKSLASIYDTATTPVGLYLGGTYGTYQVQGNGWSVNPSGAISATGATITGATNLPSSTAVGSTASGAQSVINFLNGSGVYSIGRQTDGTFFIYDSLRGAYPLILDGNQQLILGESGKRVVTNKNTLDDGNGNAAVVGGLNAAGLSVGGSSALSTVKATGPFSVTGGTATSLIDLQTTPPDNGAFAHPNGTYLQMCSLSGCLPGPYMFTQSFFAGKTRLDGTAQEIGVFQNWAATTGYAPNWTPAVSSTAWATSTSYAASAYTSNNGSIFKNRGACTSASSGTGPGHYTLYGYGSESPTDNNIPDNTCIWDFQGAATYAAYDGVTSKFSHVTEVSANGNIYSNTVNNCVPATSGSGPSGTGTNIADGTCRWNYVGLGLNDGKSGWTFGAVYQPGAGNSWGLVEDHVIKPGYGGNVWYGHEWDINNENADSYAGAPFFALGRFWGGGSGYSKPIFAYDYYGSGAVNSKTNDGVASRTPYGAHYGIYFSGSPGDVGSVIQDANIAIADNASIALQGMGGRQHSIALIYDQSTTPIALKLQGSYSSAAIDTTGASGAFGNALVSNTNKYVEWVGGSLNGGITISSAINAFAFQIGGSNLATLGSDRLNITPTTASTSSTTGALTVAGGVGIAGALNVGGAANIASTLASTAFNNGSLTVGGGLGVNGAVNASGQILGTFHTSSGSTGGFYASDRTSSNTGQAVLYRNNGINRLYDSGGNDVITYTNTSIGLAQPVTLSNFGTAAPSGTVKGTVCADSNGVVYIKTTSGACL